MKAKNTSSLASMLNNAYNAAEDTGEANHKQIADGGTRTPVQTPIEKPAENPFVVSQPQPVVTQPQPQIVQQPVQQETQQRGTIIPQPQTFAPTQPQQPKKPIISGVSAGITSQKDIAKVIDIYTYYMNMDEQVQETTRNFLNIQDSDPIEVVYSILNVDYALLTGLEDLVTLRKQEALERGFDLLTLDEPRLTKLAELTLLFVDNFQLSTSVGNKIEYCRALVKGMERIPMKALDFLAPVSELLTKGK